MGVVQEPRVTGTSTLGSRYHATTGEDTVDNFLRLKKVVHDELDAATEIDLLCLSLFK